MKPSLWLKVLSMILIPVYAAGCSTVFGRQHDEEMISFDSNVADVEVICSGKRANTPGSIPLRQSKSHSCTASLPGYEKKVFQVRSGVSWSGFGHSTAINTAIWGWWTFGIGTAIGWLIDFPSGAMRNLKEDNYYIEMRPAGTTGLGAKVLDKTVDLGKALVNVPQDIVKETAGTVLDTTVHGGASQLGISDGTSKQPTESEKGEPKKI